MPYQGSLPHIANFADDFCGGANTHEELLQVFGDFLEMCSESRITLKASKIAWGYETATFYGHYIGDGTITPSDKNLDPVRKMTPPTSKKELASVMGVFNQFSHMPDYMTTLP